MATVTLLGTVTFNTTAGNKTVTATPAASDLIVVIAPSTGAITSNVTDNNSDGLGTYTQVDSDRSGFSTSGHLTVWVRDALVGSATSTVFTATQASSTGGGLIVLKITGMNRTGSLAVRSNGGQSTGTAGTTPAPVLSATPDSANPVISAVANGTNSTTTVVQRTGYTEAFDNGYNTPATGAEVNFVNSGETSATITYGGTSASAFASVAIELDTSSIPGPTVSAFQVASWTTTTTPKTISVTGALNGDKIVVFYGGDNGTGGSNVSAASASTTAGSTGTWTEPEEGLAAGSQAWASSAYADVTADGDVTVSLDRTQGAGQQWGGFALLCRNHGGIGVHGRSAPSATETVTLTGVSQDSLVGAIAIDWDALTPVAFSPGGATQIRRSFDTNLTNYAGYWRGQNSGTRGYGIATSSTTNLHIIAVEILASAGGSFTGTASLSATATLTAAGQVEGSASSTVTAGLTAAGSANLTGSASQSVMATLTAAGAAIGAGSLAAAATLAAAGAVTSGASGSAACAIAATLTAAGVAATSSGSAIGVTAALVAAGIALGAASLGASATLAAAGSVTVSGSGSASLMVTATASAAGAVSGGGALAVTATRSAVGAGSGLATRSTTVSLVAAGNIAAAGGGSVTAVTTTTAIGSTGLSSGAAQAITAALVAAGIALGAEKNADSISLVSAGRTSTATAAVQVASIATITGGSSNPSATERVGSTPTVTD